jgi:hypothetical protein
MELTVEDLRAMNACSEARDRLDESFDGRIVLSREAIATYVDRYPDAWQDVTWLAWRLRRAGWAIPADLVWQIARIAFREQPGRNASLRQYTETLGPDNWREARTAAAAAADAAYAAAADAAYAADDAYAAAYAAAAYAAYAAAAADAAYAAAAYAAYAADAAAYAAAAYAADAADAAARKRVRAEIVALCADAIAAAAAQRQEAAQ